MRRKREIIYLSLHCHHQNDSCIKMGNDESHFNVSLIVRDKVTRQCPQTTQYVANSKHWFTTSFLLEEGAGKRCSESDSGYQVNTDTRDSHC